jgi:hypothetical protein
MPGPNKNDTLPEIQRMHVEFQKRLGVDVTDARSLAALGADPDRPIVVSWAIVDPARFGALLASSKPPARETPFVIRAQIVVPIVDPARAAQELAKLPADDACARPTGDPGRWTRWLGSLKKPADRRAAEDRSTAYACNSEDDYALLARIDGARREVRWVSAVGTGALLADAAAPVAADEPLAARLQRDGFFGAGVGVYATPAAEARGYAAADMLKCQHGIAGIPEADMRDFMWKKAVEEMGGGTRMVESAPRLFIDAMVTDRGASWTLTADGKAFFASLGLGSSSDPARLKRAIQARLKPTGVFASRAALAETIGVTGNGAYLLALHFLWPHGIAFVAANPGLVALPAGDLDAGSVIEIDTQAGTLRVRAGTSSK